MSCGAQLVTCQAERPAAQLGACAPADASAPRGSATSFVWCGRLLWGAPYAAPSACRRPHMQRCGLSASCPPRLASLSPPPSLSDWRHCSAPSQPQPQLRREKDGVGASTSLSAALTSHAAHPPAPAPQSCSSAAALSPLPPPPPPPDPRDSPPSTSSSSRRLGPGRSST